MPERGFVRPVHRQVQTILTRLDSDFMARARCYFGGGTRIVLELGEYRESRDIDFLCADRDGYRQLRETVTETSLGALQAANITLAREVRADQYGIRTFVEHGDIRMKFEIIRESRVDLDGETVAGIPVACLSRIHCFAEKFLANADRGLDTSTLSRDIVDLAFMVEGWAREDAKSGLTIAKAAYGGAVARALAAVTAKLREDRLYKNRCIDGLAISAPKTLTAGLRALARLT